MKKLISILCLLCLITGVKASDQIRFLIFADLHYDLMPDAESRLTHILRAAEQKDVDFMIDLGDIVFPIAQNQKVADLFNVSPVEKFHVLGNHDMDKADKDTYMRFFSMKAPFYSFDKGLFRFIVLDTNNFIDKEGKETPYSNSNYFANEATADYITREQQVWLKEVLQDTSKIYVLFSHAPINDQFDAIVKNKAVHDILIDAQQKGIKIAGAFGGHNHSDNFCKVDGINYIQVNSCSYLWVGSKHENQTRYSKEIYTNYPAMKYSVPYKDPIYAIVTIDSTGKMEIEGTKGEWIHPSPEEAGINDRFFPMTPSIEDRILTF